MTVSLTKFSLWKRQAAKDKGQVRQVFINLEDLEEIREHGCVLTLGRYVDTEEVKDDGVPFEEEMAGLPYAFSLVLLARDEKVETPPAQLGIPPDRLIQNLS